MEGNMQPIDPTAAKLELPAESLIDELFLAHPRANQEDYFEHLFYTLKLSGQLVATIFCLIIHGLIPGLFKTTTSARISRINEHLKAQRFLK